MDVVLGKHIVVQCLQLFEGEVTHRMFDHLDELFASILG